MSNLGKQRTYNCYCNWPDCHELRQQLLECCDPDDCWVAEPFRVSFDENSDKVMALRASIAHHISGTEEVLKSGKEFSLFKTMGF